VIVSSDSAPGATGLVAKLIEADPRGLTVVAPEALPLDGEGVEVVRVDGEVTTGESGGARGASRADLTRVARLLADRRHGPKRMVVVLEAGADVGVAAQTFLADQWLRRSTDLDALVATVDAPRACARLAAFEELARGTAAVDLAIADVVVVNGLGQTTTRGTQRLMAALRATNPVAAVVDADVEHPSGLSSRVFGRAAFSPQRWSSPAGSGIERHPARGRSAHHHQSAWVTVQVDGELDEASLDLWLAELHERHEREGARVFRLHGSFAVTGGPNRLVARGVGHVVEVVDGRPWGADNRSSWVQLAGSGVSEEMVHSTLEACRVS